MEDLQQKISTGKLLSRKIRLKIILHKLNKLSCRKNTAAQYARRISFSPNIYKKQSSSIHQEAIHGHIATSRRGISQTIVYFILCRKIEIAT